MRMSASRLSIWVPGNAGGKKVPPNLDFVSQAANESGALLVVRDDAGDGFAVLGDNEAFGVELVQQIEALLLELGCCNGFHDHPSLGVASG